MISNTSIEVSQDFEHLIKLIENNLNNLRLLKTFIPVLQEFINLLKNEFNSVSTQQIPLSVESITYFDSVADKLHIFAFNLENDKKPNNAINSQFAEIYRDAENVYRSMVQYGRGILDPQTGQFYASQSNLQELTDASYVMLNQHKIGEPVEFVEIN